MIGVTENQLQCMRPGRKLDPCLGLAASVMQAFLVIGNRLIHIEWFINIDKEMMMARVRTLIS